MQALFHICAFFTVSSQRFSESSFIFAFFRANKFFSGKNELLFDFDSDVCYNKNRTNVREITNKKRKDIRLDVFSFWWARRDLNPHVRNEH